MMRSTLIDFTTRRVGSIDTERCPECGRAGGVRHYPGATMFVHFARAIGGFLDIADYCWVAKAQELALAADAEAMTL